jgi:molybdopterin synthase catalytic subunit
MSSTNGARGVAAAVAGVTAGGDVAEVVLADIRESALSVDEVLDAVRHPRAGAIATFVGVVREHDHDQEVESLEYTAHPSAPQVLRELAERLAGQGEVIRVAAVHRVGHLEIGDAAVVVAVSAAHRGAAMDVCRELIDALKATVPIWKHQIFEDGTDEWVGTPG